MNKSTKKIIIAIAIILFVMAIFVFIIRKNKIRSILFIGDSNTFLNYSYADQIKQKYPNLIIKKIAQMGVKTDWMLQKLKEELQKNKYDAIAILGGSNDIYGLGRTDITKKNLSSMYDLAKNNGSKVLAVTPPNKDFFVNRTNEKQTLLYDLVNWIKNNKSPNYIIDFHYITNNKDFFNSTDGYLHANAAAHNILANQTAKKLNL